MNDFLLKTILSQCVFFVSSRVRLLLKLQLGVKHKLTSFGISIQDSSLLISSASINHSNAIEDKESSLVEKDLVGKKKRKRMKKQDLK